MKHFFVLSFVLLFCASCSLFSGLRKRNFTHTINEKPQTLRILVPKRYANKQTSADSAGSQHRYYTYKNGAQLYVIYTTDTLTQFQPIDTTTHIPKLHPYGGLMYKGLDSAGLFWREIRTDSFRFGYRLVPHDVEPLFDSAVNYDAMRRFKN